MKDKLTSEKTRSELNISAQTTTITNLRKVVETQRTTAERILSEKNALEEEAQRLKDELETQFVLLKQTETLNVELKSEKDESQQEMQTLRIELEASKNLVATQDAKQVELKERLATSESKRKSTANKYTTARWVIESITTHNLGKETKSTPSEEDKKTRKKFWKSFSDEKEQKIRQALKFLSGKGEMPKL